jgi:hypothetical protein
MYRPNFCVECGAPLMRKGWRVWISRNFCDDCARRLGRRDGVRLLVGIALVALAAFALGRCSRSQPPLLILRQSNSPLSDLPVNLDEPLKRSSPGRNSVSSPAQSADENVYICGARTRKGTPCHRRVHSAGERCFQHKGMPAMVPLEKLIIKPESGMK